MDSFICKIRTPQGQITKVKMQEKDKITCLKKLKRNGMTPISVEKTFSIIKPDINIKKKKKLTAKIYSDKKKKFTFDKSFNITIKNKVSIKELKKFTQEFYLLKQSNFTNNQALSTIINNTQNEYLKVALIEILNNIKSGKYMYKTMKNYSSIFPFVYINFIKTGELTNNLEESLINAIKFLEEEEKIKNNIKNEIFPSIIAFILIIVIMILLIIFGVPNLQNILYSNGSNIELPKITLFFMNIIKLLITHWYICLAVFFAILYCFIKYINTEKGRYKFDYFKYSNVLIGKITYLIEFARLLKIIYLNLNNKIRIQDALEIAKNFTNNTYMISKIEDAISNVYIGKAWISPFENEKNLNPIIIEMIKKEYDNGSFEILEKSVKYIDKEIENETNILLKKLPEISYFIVGITLILFLIIFLMPFIHIYLGKLLVI